MDQDPPPNPPKKDKKGKERAVAPALPVPRPTNHISPPIKTQAPKPYVGVSYTAADRAAPKEANEWTKVPARGRRARQEAIAQ